MAQPPASPPSSDIEGVNRDARVGIPAASPTPDPGQAIDHANGETAARPDEGAPPE